MDKTYQCSNCGEVFTTSTMANKLLFGGNSSEPPEYESQCPRCGSANYEEVVPCYLCGEPSEEGLCNACITELSKDVDKSLEIGSVGVYRQAVELNGILVELYSVRQIERILVDNLRERMKFEPDVVHSIIEQSLREDISGTVDCLSSIVER